MNKLEILKEELLNKKVTLIQLDNDIIEQGFYSFFDTGVQDNILEDGNLVITSNINEEQYILEFNVIELNEEVAGKSIVKIYNIEEF